MKSVFSSSDRLALLAEGPTRLYGIKFERCGSTRLDSGQLLDQAVGAVSALPVLLHVAFSDRALPDEHR